MKRYRYITLSLLLLLLSISALSAQKTYTLRDKQGRYEFEVETTPSYCPLQGTISVKLVKPVAGTSPKLTQIERVEYNIKDKEGNSYTHGFATATAADAALLIQSLPGREDYEIYVKVKPFSTLHITPIETQLDGQIVVENKAVPLVLVKEEVDPYKLQCRPYGGFHITVQGSEERPPKLKIEEAPATFTAREMQPTRKEIKDGVLLYHFEYNGSLPQGTYKYRFYNTCVTSDAKSFDIYGPNPDLPTVPQDLKMSFGIYVMNGSGGCANKISQFGVSSSSKDVLNKLFESINKGYKGDQTKPYPQYVDSFPSTFIKNYDVAVISQLEYEQLQQKTLNVGNLPWSNQTGSPTEIRKEDLTISYHLSQDMSLRELNDKKALPGALLIRIKRPNTGCNDYITIPITVDLDFHKRRFEILETESTLDCSIGQIIWFQGWNFCTLYAKYYELSPGTNQPDPSARPAHTSDNFGPAVSTMVDKRYTFPEFDATKRYYVELDGIDLFGNPITPKPHLIIEPTNKQPRANRLYDFYIIYVSFPQNVGYPFYSFGDSWEGELFGRAAGRIRMESWPGHEGRALNALAGMDITLVKAPEGYEEFRHVREETYLRKPDASNATNPYGGGMIRLGETVKISTTFTSPAWDENADRFYPFKFLYKLGEHGERVVYPYNRDEEDTPAPCYDKFLNNNGNVDAATKEYMEQHPIPRGIYRFKFEHPCQPGDFFYIDVNVNDSDFKPILTEPLKPVLDYSSCSEVKVYPFADGRLDYGVDKKGRPRNLVFKVQGRTEEDKELYFFPYDATGKAIDHTKFYIPIKRVDLPRTISLEYVYLFPNGQWVAHEATYDYSTKTYSVDQTGIDYYIQADSLQKDISNFMYYLPIKEYNPNNDQEDWGKDGRYRYSGGKYQTSYKWSTSSFDPETIVKVPIERKTPEPAYIRPSYVGYRCAEDKGYMEFKLINIPNKTGTVTLKDGSSVVRSENIANLSDDMTVRWDFLPDSGIKLKKEYKLEIETSACAEELPNTQKNYFDVALLDISEGLEVSLLPRRGACPGEKVTLVASNLGVPDENYKWEIYDANGTKSTPTGRIVTCSVVAPHVASDGKARYNTYTLTVTGTKCGGEQITEGVIPVSPDELWWVPQCARYKGVVGGLLTPLPGSPNQVEYPFKPVGKKKIYRYTFNTEYKDQNWNNPDNWAFLYKGQFYVAKAVPTRCTNVHLMTEALGASVLGVSNRKDKKTVRYEIASPKSAPDLHKTFTLRDRYGEPTCADIIFHSGAELRSPELLTYERAIVRYNFGIDPSIAGFDPEKHSPFSPYTEGQAYMRLYTPDFNFCPDASPIGRNNLYLIATPLHDIYSGDFSFSASPYTYQLSLKELSHDKTIIMDCFNEPSPQQSIPLERQSNAIALIVAPDAQGFNRGDSSVITQSGGILELPYFDRPEVAQRFYHHTYDPSRRESRFQYFDGKGKRFRGYYTYAKRSENAYRFVFEDPKTHRIGTLPSGESGYTMELNLDFPGQAVIVGNPFMATYSAKDFLNANIDVLDRLYGDLPNGLWSRNSRIVAYEPKLQIRGRIAVDPGKIFSHGTYDSFIQPLGAFILKPKKEVGTKVTLVFPTSCMVHRNSLESPQQATTSRYLEVTMQSLQGKDRAVVTFDAESPSLDKILLGSDYLYPTIAIVDARDDHYKEYYDDEAATGRYKLVSLISEPIDATLSLSGSVMGSVTKARLIDHKSGLEHDLTGGKSCQIKLYPDDGEDRLELRVDGDFTSVAPLPEPDAELQAQYSEGMLTVRTAQEMSSLRLVQGDGITVYTQSLPGLTEYSERILLSSGSYVVEAIGTDGVAHHAMLVVR